MAWQPSGAGENKIYMSIELNNIWKKYNGDKQVLQGIDLQIRNDSIYCLLGMNGAGKSTLLHIITALIEPDQGSVRINSAGYAHEAIAIRKRMGVLTQFNQVIGELNAYDYLSWIGLLYGISDEEINIQQNNLLQYFFEAEENLRRPARTFSSGMMKKLGICAALIHKPDILILDEPFANLDPVVCDKLCELISAYRSESRTVLISSHDLLYVNRIASHIGVLDKGKLAFDGTMKQFTKEDTKNMDRQFLKYLELPDRDESLIQAII